MRELRISEAVPLNMPLPASTRKDKPMKKNALWISVGIVATLLVTSLLWNFSMQAAGPASRIIKGRRAANNPGIANFDIRDPESKDAMSKFERRMQKFSSKNKEKN